MSICSKENCNLKCKAKGLCTKHYNRIQSVKWRSSERGRTYHVWYSMIWRCQQKSGYYWKHYGSRGIAVCERWLDFDNFIDDMGYQPKGMDIDRTNNDSGYSPDNCKWVTHLENMQNTRNNKFITINGETKTVSAWARYITINRGSLIYYMKRYGEKWLVDKVNSMQD